MSCDEHSNTISSLRKIAKEEPGRLDEALEAARAGLRECPADLWVQRHGGWAFYDVVKRALANGGVDEARTLLAEFDAIPFGAPEELLHPKMEGLRARLDPALADLGRARALTDGGRFPEALRLYDRMFEAARDAPPEELRTNYAWAIYRQVRALNAKDPIPVSQVAPLLRRFVELDVPRRDRVALLIVRSAFKVAGAHDAFFEVAMDWWDMKSLAMEDLKREKTPEGKTMPSFAESYARALMQHVELRDGEYTDKRLEAIYKLADRVSVHHPDNVNLPYAKGKLFTIYGRHAEARPLLLSVVRAKADESWPWHQLARAFEPDDPSASEACLCKAIAVSRGEGFIGGIRMELARMLVSRGEYGAARYQVERVATHRSDQGWKPHGEDREFRDASWFDEATPPLDDRALINAGAENADALMLESVPLCPALVVSHQPGSDRGPGRTFVVVGGEGAGLTEAPVRDPAFGFSKSAPGTPVWVRLDSSGGKPRVLQMSARESDLWDLLPEQTGVVESQNPSKRVAHVVLGPRKSALLDYSVCRGVASWPAGSVVAVRVRETTQRFGDPKPSRAVSARPSDELAPSDTVRTFSGMFEQVQSNFGFVDNVYVPLALIKANGLVDGDDVDGRAIASGRGDGKWRAFELSLDPREAGYH